MIWELILGGGATGLLGTAIGKVTNYFETKQNNAFILEKYALDAKLRKEEMESEFAIAKMNADSAMYASSVEHDIGYGKPSKWLTNTLRLIRPALTIMLWIMVAVVYFNTPQDLDYKGQIIGTILYCATTALLWWFGARDDRKK
jgi:hypothetical protein